VNARRVWCVAVPWGIDISACWLRENFGSLLALAFKRQIEAGIRNELTTMLA
jgi:hypothetical protein